VFSWLYFYLFFIIGRCVAAPYFLPPAVSGVSAASRRRVPPIVRLCAQLGNSSGNNDPYSLNVHQSHYSTHSQIQRTHEVLRRAEHEALDVSFHPFVVDS
jgi:hypothetical protein